ncbi:serine hydrolase domain-containing protein [Algoriphagus taiwanensis]|uniref:Serine hydrolase domain-containing protein n=1 Tax=Algoriphagus taiwanensis TaxID=1445656 RepID=A0ABQ6Q139_9BACT|nr:serine hydrolase domain-containing protein [Algoriphagus taiwanensis]
MKNNFKHFRHFSWIFILAVLIACSESSDPTPTPTPTAKQEDIAAIDSQIEGFISQYNIPGASLAISKNGKLVYQKAYGVADQAQNKAMELNTQMRVASVSKTFTGLAIMLLVQDGKIKLEDKVFGEGAILGTTYGTKAYSNRVKQVTVRHLLQMTTGGWVVSGNRDAIDYEQGRTNAGFFDWMMDNATLNFDPGSQYWYINTNYFVAARIVEKVSGKSFAQFVKERITDPLKMTATAYGKNGTQGRLPNEATYYGQGGTKGFEYNFNLERRDGDAGIVTSAPDLLRFVTAIDGNPSRPDLLDPAIYNQFIQGSTANTGFANGIAQNNQIKYFYGALPGTRSGYMFHSNGMAAALIFNGNGDYTQSNYNSTFARAHDELMVSLITRNLNVYQEIDQF